jgi:hypothetical protein
MDVGVAFVVLLLIAVFYFLPAVIANQRDTTHLGAIFIINLLFGWTILGWIAALIWAVVEQPKVKTIDNPWAGPLPPLYPERTDSRSIDEKPWMAN